MKEVGKPSGLTRRKGSSRWYYRERWPRRFSRPGTPPEVWISLNTSDYGEALERLPDARVKAAQRFRGETAKPGSSPIIRRAPAPVWPNDPARPPLTRELAAPLAKRFFREVLQSMDAEPPASSSDRDRLRLELEDRYRRLQTPEDIDEAYSEQIWLLNDAGLGAAYDSDACILLRNYLHRALTQLTALELARLDGDYRDEIADGMDGSRSRHRGARM